MKNKALITVSVLLITAILCSSCSDNYSFNFDNSTTTNPAEGEWNAICSSIKEDIEGIEGINSVTIEPVDYNKYVQDGIALIYINHDSNYAYSQSEDDALHQYIDNFQYFSDYKLIFDGGQ